MRTNDCLRSRAISSAYLDAKDVVLKAGYGWELDWQEEVGRQPPSEDQLLRELAWVVLSAGMSEVVVKAVFPRVSHSFLNWSSATEIWNRRSECRAHALEVFNSRRKVNAIIVAAGYVKTVGPAAFWQRAASADGIPYLMRLPFMGPATSRHLAKNLGISVAKPDRHLLRLADAVQVPSVDYLCALINAIVGDPIAVVDVVLWRFAAISSEPATQFRTMFLDHAETAASPEFASPWSAAGHS